MPAHFLINGSLSPLPGVEDSPPPIYSLQKDSPQNPSPPGFPSSSLETTPLLEETSPPHLSSFSSHTTVSPLSDEKNRDLILDAHLYSFKKENGRYCFSAPECIKSPDRNRSLEMSTAYRWEQKLRQGDTPPSLEEQANSAARALCLLLDIIQNLSTLCDIPKTYTSSPLKHAPTIVEFSGRVLWGDTKHPSKEHLESLLQAGMLLEALQIVHDKLACLHIQGKFYAESGGLDPSFPGTKVALVVDQIAHPPDTKKFHDTATVLRVMSREIHKNSAHSKATLDECTLRAMRGINPKFEPKHLHNTELFEKFKQVWDRNLTERTPSTPDCSLHYPQFGTARPEVMIALKKEVLGLGSYKECLPLLFHNNPFDKHSVGLLAVPDVKGRGYIEKEAFLLQKLRNQGVPFLPEVQAFSDDFMEQEKCSFSLSAMCKNFVMEKVDPSSFARIAYCVSRSLSSLHNMDLLHCDLKPENVLVKINDSRCLEKVLLSDFNLMENVVHQTHGENKKTTVFITPTEMWRNGYGEKASDIYGLGITLWHCFSSVAPGWMNCPQNDPALRLDEYDAAITKHMPYLSSLLQVFRKKVEEKGDSSTLNADCYLKLFEESLPFKQKIEKKTKYYILSDIRRSEPRRAQYRYLAWQERLSEKELLYYFCSGLTKRFSFSDFSESYDAVENIEDFDTRMSAFFNGFSLENPWSQYLKVLFCCLHPDPRRRPCAKECCQAFEERGFRPEDLALLKK